MRRLLVVSVLVGCSSQSAPSQPSVSAPLFGDDRVADVLARDAARAPRTFAEHERMFAVGRACSRADSRETYVIEEPATRFNEVVVPRFTTSPRAIVTGCNPKPESLDGASISFGLFTVMPTDPSHGAADPLATAPVEVMALDRTTGMYSFYVFDEAGVQRIVRDRNGVVSTIVGARDGAITTRAESSSRCFGCHVHGGPLMAALADPWTSWVSTRKKRALGGYSGETASVLESPALANELEGVVRNAIRAFVVSGLVPRTLAGDEPGGLPRLLRSVFCETELQFASANETMPMQLSVDPLAAAGSGLERPAALDTFPQLLPIRSEIDLRIEQALVSRGVLTSETVRAIRMIDDANEIFSNKRCSLLPRVLDGLPARDVDAHVRAKIADALPPYAVALLEGREDGREAYFTALRTRFEADLRDRALLTARLASKQAAARAMFPSDAHPLPFGIVSP